MASTHPVQSAIVNGSQVVKGTFRDYVEVRHPLVLQTDNEIQGFQLPNTTHVMRSGAIYLYDSTDTTSAHNPPSVLVDASAPGRRYKPTGDTVVAEPRIITVAGTVTVAADKAIVAKLASPGVLTINLPPVANRNGVPLHLSDFAGNADASVIVPDGSNSPGETIMSVTSWPLTSNGAGMGWAVTLWPSVDLNGWYIAP